MWNTDTGESTNTLAGWQWEVHGKRGRADPKSRHTERNIKDYEDGECLLILILIFYQRLFNATNCKNYKLPKAVLGHMVVRSK